MIKNAITKPVLRADGSIMAYYIKPDEGYVLHTKNYDVPVCDKFTGEETGEIVPGFTSGIIQIGYNYNFDFVKEELCTFTNDECEENKVVVDKMGKFELFTVPKNIVASKQIFDGKM